jgi:hypothetical protein
MTVNTLHLNNIMQYGELTTAHEMHISNKYTVG